MNQFTRIKERFHWLIYQSETASLRFWFGLASLGFASFLSFSNKALDSGSEFFFMLQLAPAKVWAIMFFVHAISLWYGVLADKYNKFLLLTEGVLGTAAWVGAAAAVTMYTGAPGGTFAGSLVALWVLIRYPTHWEWDDA